MIRRACSEDRWNSRRILVHIWHQDRLARFHKLNYKVFILLNFKKKKLSHKGKKEIRHGIHHCYAIGWSYSDNRARPKGNYAYLLLCFVFFVLIYVSLYVFVPFLHNVSRETPPSELPRTFFFNLFESMWFINVPIFVPINVPIVCWLSYSP